jgi:hypothetical protein
MAVAVGAGIKRGLFDDDPVFGSPSPSKRVRGVSVASVVGGSGPSPLRAGAQFNPFSASPDHNLVQLAQLCALFPDMDPQVSRAPSSSRFHSKRFPRRWLSLCVDPARLHACRRYCRTRPLCRPALDGRRRPHAWKTVWRALGRPFAQGLRLHESAGAPRRG